MSVSEPGKIITPWAESGLKNPIPPAANPATGRAGFDQGFSAINMTAKEAGGIPPFGQDFNGIFYEVTNILRYMQAGGQPTFSSALATAIGGYPKGAMVLGSDGFTLWQSKVDSNTDDPNSGSNKWILAIVQDVSTISDLRLTEPSRSGQLIGVTSYYGGWAAIDGAGPEFGGRFWHDSNDTTTPDNGFTCIVTAGGKRWKRVKGQYSIGHAGAVSDGFVTDSTVQIQHAFNLGGVIEIPDGEWLADQLVITQPSILRGFGTLKLNQIRLKTSRFSSEFGGVFDCRSYSTDSRAFLVDARSDAADYEDIKILFNRFNGFFYSTAFLARDYSLVVDPDARAIKNTKIIGCTSIAPSGLNAGHFQHIGVTNSEVSHCSTYGGQGAASYNFINQNGYVRIIGNYDENNLYGSCELENSAVSNSVISGNTFGNDLWVDDTSNVTVSGNAVAGVLKITTETADVYNLTVSANTAKRIRVEQFGGAPVGFTYDSSVVGNTVTGANPGGNDMFLGALVTGDVSSNRCNGPSTHIGVVRHAGTNLTVRNNTGKGGALLISGAGGTIVEYGNIGMVLSGASDSKHLSNLMTPSKDFLDLPGKYLHGTKFTRSIAPAGTATISMPIPVGPNPSFRGVALWVLIRDIASNNISSYRIDGRYVFVGSVQLVFGTSYSTQGVDAASVTVANGGSTTSSINVLVTNTSGSKTFQVTIMPEVSSRLGIED